MSQSRKPLYLKSEASPRVHVSADGFRSVARRLPRPIRRALGYSWDYVSRLGRWAAILQLIHGKTKRDKFFLAASAAASPITSFRQFGRWQDPGFWRTFRSMSMGSEVFVLGITPMIFFMCYLPESRLFWTLSKHTLNLEASSLVRVLISGCIPCLPVGWLAKVDT